MIKECCCYQYEELSRGLRQLLAGWGGIEEFVKPGQKVLLKANLLRAASPESAIITHPALVKAVAELVLEAGGTVVIGDSPGGPFTRNQLDKIYQQSGLAELVQDNIKLNYETGEVRKKLAGEISQYFVIGRYVTEADVIINLPKLKTHGLTLYTGAVKNLFGTIPGLLKAEYHLKMPRADLFSEMLLDLAQLVVPDLNIMDAVLGMEGEGPSAGTPRQFNYLLASTSALALDIAGAYLMDIKPLTKVPLLEAARGRGMISSTKDIEFRGDQLTPAEGTDIPSIERSSNLIDQRLPRPLGKLVGYFLRPRPEFDSGSCQHCGVCVENCPVGAIELKGEGPEVELENCIRCFCCQELCPYKAVRIKRPWPGKLIFG